ncbi:MAG: hypothetical protein HPY69_11070 [Armatimonadetes bacterium]|nr:hypothetical protein [Armatimonadota bacterium]
MNSIPACRIVVAVAATILLLGARAMPAQPVAMQGADDATILEWFLKHTESNVARVTPEALAAVEQAEDICWVWVPYTQMPLLAYELTADPRYLDLFVGAMDSLLTRLRAAPDGYLGFRGLPYELFRNPATPTAEADSDVADFEVAHLICHFAELVQDDGTLRERYAAKLLAYLDVAEKNLVGPKLDSRQRYVDLGETGAIIRMPSEFGNYRDNLTNPHNKQSKFCRTYLALYRVTGKDDYFRRAVKLGTRFKHTLKLVDDHYTWHYWDPAGDWDRKPDNPQEWKHWIGPEHRGGYHALTVQMATELYDHGVVFDRTDMQRFVNTQMQVCWNGSLEDPKFANTAGEPMTDPNYLEMMAPALARFDPRIREYCYGSRATQDRLARREHGWQGGVGAMGYLAGKYLEPGTADPTRARYAEQFRQQADNAAFLQTMRYDVGAGQ